MNLERYTTYLQYDLNRSSHTVTAYIHDLTEFINFHTDADGDFKPAEITQRHVRAWLAACSSAGNSPRTLRRKASSLSTYFRYLMLFGKIKTSPTSRLKLPKYRAALPSFVKEREMELLLADGEERTSIAMETIHDGADKEVTAEAFTTCRDALIIELLYATGMRRAELSSLKTADADTSRLEITVSGKGNKMRKIPIATSTAEKIKTYNSLCSKLFPTHAPELLLDTNGNALNYTAIYGIVKKRLSLTHTAKPSPHTLRHSFATSMLNNGADINTVKKFLGHASIDTTQIYTHVSLADLKRNYNQAHPRVINTKGGHHGN